MQQNLNPTGGVPPGRQHRLAPLTRTQPFGDSIDEQVVMSYSERPRVASSWWRADLRDRGARQQQSSALVAECVLDVAHRQATGEELDGQVLQGLRLGVRGPPSPGWSPL
jgi:hypothetical protein